MSHLLFQTSPRGLIWHLKKKILPEPIIKSIPIKFNNYKIGKRNNLISTDFTHTWALANYFANGDKTKPPSSDDQLINEKTRSREDKQNCTGSSTDTNGNDSALSVKEQDLTYKSEKVPKNDGMPTWAATNSLLLSQSLAIKQPHTCTNTAVVAPLFKSSPTDYGTLYTILQLEALTERRPPWPRQIFTLILLTVKMLSLGCVRLTPPPPLKKTKTVLDHYLHHDLGMLPLLWWFFLAHLLILQYPDHHQNLISSSLYYSGPLHQISSQSVYNFLSNVVHRQTDRQTN